MAAASAPVKSAALRAKTAAGAPSGVDSRKRKRGALQDISNNNSSARTASSAAAKKAAGAGAVVKPVVKRSVASVSSTGSLSANVTVRGRVGKTTTSSSTTAGGVTKRRRQEVQTSLLSFQSLTTKAPKSVKSENGNEIDEAAGGNELEPVKEEPVAMQSDSQATQGIEEENETMECQETLVNVKPDAEAAPVSAPVKAVHARATTTQSTAEVPPYHPRPFVFKFNHTGALRSCLLLDVVMLTLSPSWLCFWIRFRL